MERVCLHPVARISVEFFEVKYTDNVKYHIPKARCSSCGSKLPRAEVNAQKAIDLAFAGLEKESPDE